jgi:hypothetical protein
VSVLLPLLWFCAGLACSSRGSRPQPVEPQRAETIDFDALRAQAAVALETLLARASAHIRRPHRILNGVREYRGVAGAQGLADNPFISAQAGIHDFYEKKLSRRLRGDERKKCHRTQKLPWQEGYGAAVSVNQLLDRGLVKRFQLLAIQDGCCRAVRDTHPIT